MQILKPLLKCFSSLYNLEIESLLFLIKSYQTWKKRQKVFLTFEFSKSICLKMKLRTKTFLHYLFIFRVELPSLRLYHQ